MTSNTQPSASENASGKPPGNVTVTAPAQAPLADEQSLTEGDDTRPLALVRGEPLAEMPQDLYIPPDALEVILDTFEGPLDLLLYLIKRQNLDILNIPIAHITQQYMEYIRLMETMRLELAAEYLLMAAMLAEIKSRMLLPRVETDEDDEDDPRAELIRRLQEYEQFKEASEKLAELPRLERDLHELNAEAPVIERDMPLPDLTLKELLLAFKDVAQRNHAMQHHNISREVLTVRERMTQILSVIRIGEFCEFSTCFQPEEGRQGIVVTFLAILELCKESSIDIVQSAPYAPIYLKPRSGALADEPDIDETDVEFAASGEAQSADDDSFDSAQVSPQAATSGRQSDNHSEFSSDNTPGDGEEE